MLNKRQKEILDTRINKNITNIKRLLEQNEIEVAYTVYSTTYNMLSPFDTSYSFKARLIDSLLKHGFNSTDIDAFMASFQAIRRDGYQFSAIDKLRRDV